MKNVENKGQTGDLALDPTYWEGARLAWVYANRMDGWENRWRSGADRLGGTGLARTLTAVRLLHALQTATTWQLHALDPAMPKRPAAALWGRLAAAGIIDCGFPVSRRSTSMSPKYAPWMALQLTNRTPPLATRDTLLRLGANQVDIALLGGGSLRTGRPSTDRHNLDATGIAVVGNRRGWQVVGESGCRFDLMTHDPTMGHGGPDAAWISRGLQVCFEVTRTFGRGTLSKIPRWQRALAHPGCENLHVVWVDVTETGAVKTRLTHLSAQLGPHSHVTTLAAVLAGTPCTDGWNCQPRGAAPADAGWWGRQGSALAAAVGWPGSLPWPPLASHLDATSLTGETK